MSTELRHRLLRDGLLLTGFIVGVGQAVGLVALPIDTWLYWTAGQSLDHLYEARWSDGGLGYVYPPLFAQLMSLVQPLGWPLFTTLWTTLIFAALWYAARGWAWVALVLGCLAVAFPSVLPIESPLTVVLGYSLNGNLQLIIAAVTVASLSRAGLASVGILTKIGPAVELAWFAFRGEMRQVTRAIAVCAVLVLIGFVAAPALWIEWIAFTVRNLNMESPIPVLPIPFALRIAMSAGLLWWGASRSARWTVPIAVGWSIPVLYGWSFLGIWIAALPLMTLEAATVRRAVRLRDRVACYSCGQSIQVIRREMRRWPTCASCSQPMLIERRSGRLGMSVAGRRSTDAMLA